jgi:oxygen-independent coproporphyrinogen-3 oxidase
MDMKKELLGCCPVDTIFIGGGTPSVLDLHHIEILGSAIARNFDLRSLSEFTCEVEVKSVSREKLQALRDIGVNRISFGAQTFSEQYRSIFTLEQVTETALLINDLFAYTNVDMLYGMAGQSFEQVLADVLAIANLGTTTIDVYPINNLSATRLMHIEMARAGLKLLPEATRVQFRVFLDETLRDLGYAPISGYGFAKKTPSAIGIVQHSPKFLYHDLVYGYYGDEIIGYGASAFSQMPGFNIYNYADRRSYVNEILANKKLPHLSFGPITAPERGIVFIPFRGILEKSRISWEEISEETMQALRDAVDAKLVVEQDDSYTLTKVGWIFYVNLMYYFMPNTSKKWVIDEIERQHQAGKRTGDTSLAILRYL